MINKVTLLGHVGRDPEIRHTASGNAIGNLSIATSERWKNKSCTWKVNSRPAIGSRMASSDIQPRS